MDALAAARSVAELVTAGAADAERLRRLPQATVDALVAAGLMRMYVPAVYGGPEVDPPAALAAIAEVARADAAAGWCTMIGATTSSLAAFLPAGTAAAIYGDPGIVTGGVFAPNGQGAVAGDTVTVTGRWQWGSGTQHCRWIVGGVRCDDGVFRVCYLDAADVTFHDTWYTSGLRGSGSLDFSVDGAIVPLDRTFPAFGGGGAPVGYLGHFPNFTLLAAGVAAAALGIGRRALDELAALATEKRPQFSNRTLAQSAYTQIELARAEAGLRSARALLLDEVGAAWETCTTGDAVTIEQRVAIRLAGANAAEQAARAADVAYTLAGGTAVYETSVLQRLLRDAHVPTQHLQIAPKLYETVGRALLGQEIDATTL